MLIKMLNLGKKPKKVNLNKEISGFLKENLGSYKFEPAFKLTDFNRIKEAVDKGIAPEKIQSAAEKGSEEEQEARMVQIAEHFELLKQSIPFNLSVDLFGVDEREPSDFEKSKFIRRVRVLQDPNHILELMRAGSLTGTEIDALNEFYPERLQKNLASEEEEEAPEEELDGSAEALKTDIQQTLDRNV